MKAGTVLLFAGAAGLGYWLVTTGKNIQKNLTLQLLTGGFKSVTRKEITGGLEFRIINPEKANLTVNSTFFKFMVGDKVIGTAQTETPVNIGKVSSKTFNVNFQLPLLSLLSSVPGIIEMIQDKALNVTVEGFVDTNLGRLNHVQTFSF